MKKFKISISTPVGKKFESDEVVMINANLSEGRIGIMANHSPLVSSLKISDFSIKFKNGSEEIGVIHGGVFSVVKNEVTILTTRFDWGDEVNISETQKEIKNIINQLQSDVKKVEAESLNNRYKYAELKLKIKTYKKN
ncbi:MAG: ATP synthase F1 subunit epsilon [Mycoplasmataceae bacterium]|nr:ATP synthase F1 subunit epsilon [Mycoplasmataceae bacterium]